MQIREKCLVLFLLLLGGFISADEFDIVDGNVTFPTANVSEKATYYTVKEVEFFVAQKTDGTIISHKNACQACGPVGFVQNGTAMKCNGCGLEYEIEILGVDNPGSCWPFYVPNRVNGATVHIALSDLGLEDTPVIQQNVSTGTTVLSVSSEAISFQLPAKGVYTVEITTLQGKNLLQKHIYNSGDFIRVETPMVAAGHYILQLRGQGLDIKKVVQFF